MADDYPSIIFKEEYNNGAVVDIELENEAPPIAVNEKVINSSEETPTKEKGKRRSDDATFFAALLTHIDGAVSVDYDGIAAELGLSNTRSVANRYSLLKKKYGFTLSTSTKNNSGNKDNSETGVAATPTKINADKVKKPRTPKKTGTTPRKPAGKKAKKELAEDATNGSNANDKAETMDQGEDMENADKFVPVAAISPKVDADGKTFPNL
ncbi:MAG: hypothetical protein M1836_003050 [Candelina mexicana]|nr:MAG: hypothetical protein M1836_003050 [Candelina mexicana]